MDTPSPTSRVWPWAVFALGVVARLAPIVLPFDFAGPDSVTYLEPARSLAGGLGYSDAAGAPSALRPPGYPAFLALWFALGGDLGLVRLVQAILGGLSAVLVLKLLERRGFARWAPWGGVLAAIDPIAVGQSPFILREALLSFLLIALVAARSLSRGRRAALLGGLCLTALALTHQLYAILGGFLFLGEVCALRRRIVGRALLPWVAMGLLVGWGVFLWASRTHRVAGHFSLSASANAVPARELYFTTACPNSWLNGDPATGFQADAFAEERLIVDRVGVPAAKEIYYRRARENWTQHPLRSLGRLALMNVYYWAEIPGSIRLAYHPRLFWMRWLLIAFHWVRLVCAFAGILYLLRSGAWIAHRTALAALVFLALAPALLYPVPRYLGPAVPILDLLATIGLGRSLEARRKGVRA